MELVEAPTGDGLGIPKQRESEMPTEKIFDSDRNRAAQAVLASLRSGRGISNATWVTLCATTFVLGIALTLMVSPQPAPRRPIEAAPPGPASTAIVAQVPAPPTEPVVVSLPPPPVIPPMRRPPQARPARALRPRPVRAVQSAPPAPKPWVDPFAD
jgi:hypothetical protein